MINKQLACEIKPYTSLFLFTVAGGIAGGILGVLQADVITRILDKAIFLKQGLMSMQPLFVFWAFILVGRAVLTSVTSFAAHKLAEQIKLSVRLRLIRQLMSITPVTAAGLDRGAELSLLSEGVEQLEEYFTRYLPQLGMAVIIPLIILGVVFPLDLFSAGVLFLTACIIPVFTFLIGRSAGEINQEQWGRLSQLSAHFFDVVDGLTTLKMFGQSRGQAKVIGRMAEEFRVCTMRVLRVAFLSAFVLELFSTIGTALVAVTIGLKLLAGSLTFYQAFFILLLAPDFYLPLRLLGSYFHAGLAGTAAAKSIHKVLGLLPPIRKGRKILSKQAVRLSFSDVGFTYRGQAAKALDKLTFSVVPGESVALVGETGSGKSTVFKLLLGFIKPTGGEILVNDVPLEELEYNKWLEHIAYVPQQPHIFTGTIAENICLGPLNHAQMIEAAKAAGAHDFIAALPMGYQTLIGEGGLSLSGGERQRLSLARAFFKDAPLLLLDEPTSALDAHYEQQVADILKTLLRGRTTLIIAHRLSTATAADKTLVFSNGRIVEAGVQQELLREQGFYYKLVKAYRGEL